MQNKEEDQAPYELSYDQETGKIRVEKNKAPDQGSNVTTYHYTIYTILNSTKNFTENVTMKEEVIPRAEPTPQPMPQPSPQKATESRGLTIYEILLYLAYAIGCLLLVIGIIRRKLLIHVLWMTLNQQRLLLLFVLIGSAMHKDVKLILTKQNIGLFHFGFLESILPDFVKAPPGISSLDQVQQTSTMRYIGFEFESSIRTYWIFIQIFLFFIASHIIWKVLSLIFPCLSKGNNLKKEEEDQNENEQDAPEDPPAQRVDILQSEEENEGGSESESVSEPHPENLSEHLSEDHQNPDEENQMPHRLPQNPYIQNIGFEEAPSCDSTQDQEYAEETVRDGNKLVRLFKWGHGAFSQEFFWSVEIRMMLESFMGVGLICVSEMKSTTSSFSFFMTTLILLEYTAFYIFVCTTGILETLRRLRALRKTNTEEDKQDLMQCEGGESDSIEEEAEREDQERNLGEESKQLSVIDEQEEGKEDDQEAVHEVVEEQEKGDESDGAHMEVFWGISDNPYAALYHPFNMTREIVIIFFAFFDVFNNTTIWMLYLILIISQALYTIEARKHPKFDCLLLEYLNITYEIFFLLFIILFAVLKSSADWDYTATKYIIITILFFNILLPIIILSIAIFLPIPSNHPNLTYNPQKTPTPSPSPPLQKKPTGSTQISGKADQSVDKSVEKSVDMAKWNSTDIIGQ